MIAFDTSQIDSVYGMPIDLLGIDIVHEMAESLIDCTDQISNRIRRHLNHAGLFNTIADAKNAIDALNTNHANWEPCWVYKIII